MASRSPAGTDAAWAEEVFGKVLCRSDGVCGKTSEMLRGKELVATYFSASWCGYCRRFSPLLEALYRGLPPDKLEVVYVACGDTPSEFEYNTTSKPWLYVPYETSQRIGYVRRSIREGSGMAQGTLAAKHGIEALPSLVVMGGRDGGVITTEGRLDVNPNLTPLQIYSQWATALPSANAAHPSSGAWWQAGGALVALGLLGSVFRLGSARTDGSRGR